MASSPTRNGSLRSPRGSVFEVADLRERFARLTQEIFSEVRRETYPGENQETTEKVREALSLADKLVREDPGYVPTRDALRRMKRRRS